MSLAGATRSEFTKQFSTSIWWILGLVMVIYLGSMGAGLAAAIGFAASGIVPDDAMGSLPGGATVLYSLSTSLGYVFALIIGTLMVTSEFRHATLTPTFLAVPARARVLGGKLIVGAVLGVLYALLALASTVGPASGLLAAFGQPIELDSSQTWAMFGRAIIAMVLWTLMGIGLGALLRNQVVAIVAILAFTQFVEPIVRAAGSFVEGLGGVANFLPGAASDALVGASLYDAFAAPASDSLAWWAGGLVLVAYAAVFLVLGYVTSWRRDVG